MQAAAIPTNRIAEIRLAGWLAAAAALHGLLLLLPHTPLHHPVDTQRPLSVSLQSREIPRPEPPLPSTPTEQVALPFSSPPAAAVPTTAPPALTVPNALTHPEEHIASAHDMTTAELLDLARQRESAPTRSLPERKLGVHTPQPLPPNWRPGAAEEANRFDGMVLPDRGEIVDRWLSADGSHNVVIRTATGETYCGRVEAWNPTNPLYEPIMTFRTCGGGGKRTFEMARPHVENPPGDR